MVASGWKILDKQESFTAAAPMYGIERGIVPPAVFLAAAYATPFTDNRLPKKVEQQTTFAVYKTRNTSAALSCSKTLPICI